MLNISKKLLSMEEKDMGYNSSFAIDLSRRINLEISSKLVNVNGWWSDEPGPGLGQAFPSPSPSPQMIRTKIQIHSITQYLASEACKIVKHRLVCETSAGTKEGSRRNNVDDHGRPPNAKYFEMEKRDALTIVQLYFQEAIDLMKAHLNWMDSRISETEECLLRIPEAQQVSNSVLPARMVWLYKEEFKMISEGFSALDEMVKEIGVLNQLLV